MPVSRRTLLSSSAAATAAAVLAPLVHPSASTTAHAASTANLGSAASTAALPEPEVVALHRMAYGPRPGDAERVKAMGLTAYIEEQLNPTAIDDSACDGRLAAARLKISYGADAMGRYPAVEEARPLGLLAKSTAELWELNKGVLAYAERTRPFEEVRVATWLRAVYSKRQLLEVLVDFWHNHFNVNANSDFALSTTFPVYDRIVRSNCLGNFRTFVEEIGRSTAMMYYLDNVSNRAGGGEGGNENYARELFELHTLGSDNYLKFYDDRRTIGTISYGDETFARGYIDDDVYEASRCLTGWTVGNGRWDLPDTAPNNGEFYYNANWHDTNPKTVLSIDGVPNIPRSQPDMKDARDVYTILARHLGTARHVCTKLCRRLIADYPPSNVVNAAVDAWMTHRDAPDQLVHVVRAILNSQEFTTIWGQKVKRPFEATVAYMRATNAELPVDYFDAAKNEVIGLWGNFHHNYGNSGHRIYEWPTPNGHPDLASYWASTNGMLRRWNMPYIITRDWGGGVVADIVGQTDMGASCTAIVDFWISRLCGFAIDPTARQALIAFLAQGGDVNAPPKPLSNAPDWKDPNALVDRLLSMVQLLAMSPDFHTR